MTTIYIAERVQPLDSFILEHCGDISPQDRPALCETIAKYNSPRSLISRNQ